MSDDKQVLIAIIGTSSDIRSAVALLKGTNVTVGVTERDMPAVMHSELPVRMIPDIKEHVMEYVKAPDTYMPPRIREYDHKRH